MNKAFGAILAIFLIGIIGTVLLSVVADNTAYLSSDQSHSDELTASDGVNVSLDYDHIVEFGASNPSACNVTAATTVANETITALTDENVSLTKEYVTAITLVTNNTGGETVGEGNYTFHVGYPNSYFELTDEEYNNTELNITYTYTDNLNGTSDYTVYNNEGYFLLENSDYDATELTCEYTFEVLTNDSAKVIIGLLPLLFVIGMILFVIAKWKEEGGDLGMFGG